jgi:hypothetical protein
MENFAERHFSRLIVGIWILAALAILFLARDAIATWKMGDPDDQMRLLQVRDWLAGQSWWDVTQYRMNAPDGGTMHWSRVVDVPLGLVIFVATPFLGQAIAEQVAASLVPLLTLCAALTINALVARRLFGAWVAIVATGLIITIAPFTTQMVPMRMDHHGWQIVCFLAGLWALFDTRSRPWSACILGVSCGLWIEISVEGLPFSALLLTVSALGWIFPALSHRGKRNDLFPIALSSAAVSTLLFYGATEGARAANFCDALSPVHVAVFAVMAAIVVSGAMIEQAWAAFGTPVVRLGICALAGIAGIATLLAIAPQCAGDAFASLDPLVRAFWYDRTSEGLPLWAGPLDVALHAYIYMLFGGIAFVYLWLHNKQITKPDALRLLLLYGGTWAIGVFVSRTSVYAMSVANLFLAAMVVDIFTSSEQRRNLVELMTPRLFALFLAMPILSAQALIDRVNAVEARADPALDVLTRTFEQQALACQKSSAAAALNQLPTSTIMAGLDTNPAILQVTKHLVVASGHHRNQAAMADVIRTFTGTADQAARIISARNIRFVVICDGSYELALYAHQAPEGMLSQLRAGKLPYWLQRKPDIGPFQIFEVNRAMLPKQMRPS